MAQIASHEVAKAGAKIGPLIHNSLDFDRRREAHFRAARQVPSGLHVVASNVVREPIILATWWGMRRQIVASDISRFFGDEP